MSAWLEAKDAAKAVPILDVVSEHVQLDKYGKGLCPFHEEKTPSFKIYENTNTYHCFGCGCHGDTIAFVEKIKQISFREALSELTGLTIREERKQVKRLTMRQLVTKWSKREPVFIEVLLEDQKHTGISWIQRVKEAMEPGYSHRPPFLWELWRDIESMIKD